MSPTKEQLLEAKNTYNALEGQRARHKAELIKLAQAIHHLTDSGEDHGLVFDEGSLFSDSPPEIIIKPQNVGLLMEMHLNDRRIFNSISVHPVRGNVALYSERVPFDSEAKVVEYIDDESKQKGFAVEWPFRLQKSYLQLSPVKRNKGFLVTNLSAMLKGNDDNPPTLFFVSSEDLQALFNLDTAPDINFCDQRSMLHKILFGIQNAAQPLNPLVQHSFGEL